MRRRIAAGNSRILDYFGDPESAGLWHVRQLRSRPRRRRADDRTSLRRPTRRRIELQCIRMALSGVARTQGRVGKGLVAKMLCGSRSQPIRQLRLDQLSTFGLLSYLRQSEATSLLNALIKADLIEQTENQRNRPTVKLTSRGEQVMKGQLRLDRHGPMEAPNCERNCGRSRWPRRRPEPHELSEQVPRLGHTEQLTPSPRLSRPTTAERTDECTASPTNHPDYFWTWRVVSAGCTPAECCADSTAGPGRGVSTSPASCRSRYGSACRGRFHASRDVAALAPGGRRRSRCSRPRRTARDRCDRRPTGPVSVLSGPRSQIGFGSDGFVGQACLTCLVGGHIAISPGVGYNWQACGRGPSGASA